MNPVASLSEIERLYLTYGGLHYGEGVTQLEHALQSAALAEAEQSAPSLVIAALLHDIGHFFAKEEDVAHAHIDDHHEAVGAKVLAKLFGEDVWRPIALHVAAKRYLCAREPDYFNALSLASQRSLQLQGGPFGETQAAGFERAPYWRESVALRRFDDMGKRADISRHSFAHFLPMMRNLCV
jgi:phosphonate degradation associated HDIG domain protein